MGVKKSKPAKKRAASDGGNTRARARRPAILAGIFARISAGESVSAICRTKGLPSEMTFWRWIAADHDQLAKYEAALAMRAHVFAEELIAIADDAANDYMDTENGPVLNQENIQRAKLRVNTRQWVMQRLLPKKYGERIALEHSGVNERLDALNAARLRALEG